MELKIKIKEVKEEWRQLTELETLLTDLSRLNQVPESYKDKLKWQLKLRGITGYDISSERILGLFRTETIRDATLEEYRAWAYLQLKGHCTCTERKLSSVDCGDCFLSGACIASDYKTKIAIYILKGKEVILELV